MFYKKIFYLLGLILICVFLPSCIKYYDLSKTEFPQGKDQPDKRTVVYDNLHSISINDQFATLAQFDVLMLTDTVRSAYVDINSEKRGKDSIAKEALLRKQLEENKHWISFYILADIRDKMHVALTDKNSLWSFYLLLSDNQKIMPISIKEVDIEPEYQFLFGHRFNLFKRYYELKFPAADLSGSDYLHGEGKFKFVISSPSKKVEVEWGKKEGYIDNYNRRALKDEDYYWL